MKVGHNKGIDRIRSLRRETHKSEEVTDNESIDLEAHVPEPIPDSRLRLIFTCCHPALEEKSRVALTLRNVCNLTTREIAQTFLDTEKNIGQRIFRAKEKIKTKGIGFAVPEPKQWQDRLTTVLSTIYLIFTTGYINENNSNRDLCEEAIFLARLLVQLKPNEPEIEGILALMLLTEARRSTRIDQTGAVVPVEHQDHLRWQTEHIAEAQILLVQAMEKKSPGPFQIKAVISDCHMMKPKPDWEQMSLLYGSLWKYEPSPVVALNWAVVMAETQRVELAMQKLEELEKELKNFQPWQAVRAHVLEKIGRVADAKNAYRQAIDNAQNPAARKLLENKLTSLNTSFR
jgi:RNA polymerase sigma-70 factor (ECF subfamily)